MILGIIIYLILFTAIVLYRFHYGLFLLLLLLPTYLIRFDLSYLPTTLLETMMWIIFVVWLIRYNKKIILNLKLLFLNHQNLFIASILFLIAATISIFTSVNLKSAAGEWKAFYIEPFLIFLVLITTLKKEKDITNYIILPLILSGLVTSILAIYQHFTGWMVPWDFWENRNTFRITGWYGYPNAVGLFLAPLVPLALYISIEKFIKFKKRNNKLEIKNLGFMISSFLFLIFAPCAILFAKSTGSFVGMTAGIGILLLFYKKTRWPAVAFGAICLVSILGFPGLSSIREEITLQDRSGQIRISIWNETISLLSDRPILGTGLGSYTKRITPYHTTVNGEGIEIFHHPHNLFLSIWVYTGLLGIFAFLWVITSIFNIQYSIFKTNKKLPFLNYFLISSIIVILTMGLVDTPYIKNDLSIFFWTIIGLLLIKPYDQKLENNKS